MEGSVREAARRVLRRVVPRLPRAERMVSLLDPLVGPPSVPTDVRTGDVTLALDLRDQAHRRMWWGVYERDEASAARRLLRPGDVAVDVGANSGWFTALAARAVGPTGAVHAFEPMPRTLALLRRTVELSALANVIVHPVAAYDRDATLEIADAGDETGWASLVYRSPERSITTVRAVALGPYLDRVVEGPVRLVKIDVEGAEPMVLASLRERLARRETAVLCELDPVLLGVTGTTPEAVVDSLLELGLAPFEVGRSLVPLPAGARPRTANTLFTPPGWSVR